MPEFIDIHAHVNFEAYLADRDEVIKRTLKANTWMINVGTEQSTSLSAVKLAHQYEKGVYAIVGLHPVHTAQSYYDKSEFSEDKKEFTEHGENFDYYFYKKLTADPKVVAIGECGLDYFRADVDTVTLQKENFEKQIMLSKETGKPLMLHVRNAYKDAHDILKNHSGVRGDVHFFAGTIEEAKLFLDLGFTLSFTGVITFTKDYDDVIKYVPLDRILSETDCPYVTPAPHRGKRNEPLFVQEVVKKIAEIKGLPLEEVKKALIYNAFSLFGLSV